MISNILKTLLVPLTAISLLVAVPLTAQAGTATGLDTTFRDNACDGITGMGVADCGDDTALTNLLGNVLNVLSFVIGAGAVISIIIGGFRYITANGDAQAAATARQTIIFSIIGLVVALAAQGIVRFVLNNV